MDELEGRRPLKVREAGAAVAVAAWLSRKNLTPNQISVASVFCAIFSAVCLLRLPHASGWSVWLWPLAAAFFIQCRLLCNLFDGMVAVEGGKSTPAGELYNDLPDRIADPIILVSAGYAAIDLPLVPMLGWLAALLAVMTAYVRLLAVSAGGPMRFQGPMAKQQRMAIITVACVLWPIAYMQQWHNHILLFALLVIVAGSILTVVRRTVDAYNSLSGT